MYLSPYTRCLRAIYSSFSILKNQRKIIRQCIVICTWICVELCTCDSQCDSNYVSPQTINEWICGEFVDWIGFVAVIIIIVNKVIGLLGCNLVFLILHFSLKQLTRNIFTIVWWTLLTRMFINSVWQNVVMKLQQLSDRVNSLSVSEAGCWLNAWRSVKKVV